MPRPLDRHHLTFPFVDVVGVVAVMAEAASYQLLVGLDIPVPRPGSAAEVEELRNWPQIIILCLGKGAGQPSATTRSAEPNHEGGRAGRAVDRNDVVDRMFALPVRYAGRHQAIGG